MFRIWRAALPTAAQEEVDRMCSHAGAWVRGIIYVHENHITDVCTYESQLVDCSRMPAYAYRESRKDFVKLGYSQAVVVRAWKANSSTSKRNYKFGVGWVADIAMQMGKPCVKPEPMDGDFVINVLYKGRKQRREISVTDFGVLIDAAMERAPVVQHVQLTLKRI